MTHIFNSLAITDYIVGDGINVRTPVRVATTTAGTLATDFANGSTIDGVLLATNDRILIKDQASTAENGTYLVQASGAPIRDIDLEDTASALGLLIWVREGTANAGTGWYGDGTIGTNATFSRYDLNGVLSVDRGGTGGTTFTNNSILKGNGTAAIAEITPAASSVLVTDGSSVPSLSTTLPASITIPSPIITNDITFDKLTNDLILSVPDQTVGISTLNAPDLAGTTDTIVATNLTQTLTNKSLSDTTTFIVDSVDNTKKIALDVGGSTGTVTTLITTQTANRSISFPDASGTIALLSDITGLDTKESVFLGTTVDLNSNPSISGTITYNNVGGASGRGQITATLAVSDVLTVDGISIGSAQNGSRILLKNQTSGDQNGIWTTTISGTSLTLDRATDFDTDEEVTAAAFTFIESGITLADTGWVLTTNDPITIGGPSGTSLSWAQFSSQGTIIAGAGLTKTGNTIDAVGANTIQVNANNLQIKSSSTANNVLLSSGTTTIEPTWGTLPLADPSAVSGILDEVNGGTGQSTLATGDMLLASASNTFSKLSAVAAKILATDAAGTVAWRNTAHISTIYDPANPALETLILTGVTSAVNEITVTNAATTTNPSISTTGTDTNIGLDIITKGTGVVTISTDSGTSVGELRLADNTGGEYVGIDVPATVTTYTMTLPNSVGTSGQVLTLADNSGNLTFGNVSTKRDFAIEPRQVQLSSTTSRPFASFAWDQSDVGGATTYTITFYYVASTRLGTLEIYNEITSTVLQSYVSGTDFANANGIVTLTFSDVGSDALITFRGKKSAPGGVNPKLFGLRISIS